MLEIRRVLLSCWSVVGLLTQTRRNLCWANHTTAVRESDRSCGAMTSFAGPHTTPGPGRVSAAFRKITNARNTLISTRLTMLSLTPPYPAHNVPVSATTTGLHNPPKNNRASSGRCWWNAARTWTTSSSGHHPSRLRNTRRQRPPQRQDLRLKSSSSTEPREGLQRRPMLSSLRKVGRMAAPARTLLRRRMGYRTAVRATARIRTPRELAAAAAALAMVAVVARSPFFARRAGEASRFLSL